MSNRELLVNFLNYTQEQNNIYESVIKSMQESHNETSTLLTTYFTNPIETPVETFRETFINASNNIRDNSLNDVASLSDISTLINVLRENINILARQNRTSNNIRPPEPNTTGNAVNSILANGTVRHITPPLVTFSPMDNRRIVHEIPRSVGDITSQETTNGNSNIRPTRPQIYGIENRLQNQIRRIRRLGPPLFFGTPDSLIDTGDLDSPVRVRPSIAQIRNGTQTLTALGDISNNTQTHCPIDLNIFAEGNAILKIIGCGHIFREMNLRNHFRYSPKCPICRYDIRDYVVPIDSQ